MSIEGILNDLINDFNIAKFDNFFRQKSRFFRPLKEDLSYYENDNFTNGKKIGEIKLEDRNELIICAFQVNKRLTERAGKKAQYIIGKKILKDSMKYAGGIFIFYDFDGNLILAKKIKSKLKPYKLEDGAPGILTEDVYVNEDGIFVIRVNKKMSTEKIVVFDLIEQYDFNFDLIASYNFAKPITMTVATEYYSPWYHKFCYKDGLFYFMISQPFEQLIAFKANK